LGAAHGRKCIFVKNNEIRQWENKAVNLQYE
jgi:hypothetical protein